MLFARFRYGWFCGGSWLVLDLMVRYYFGLFDWLRGWLCCFVFAMFSVGCG